MHVAESKRNRALREGREDIGLRIAKAMAHPTRVRILEILSEGDCSPVEIAVEMDGDKRNQSNVNYHMGILRDLGCVEKVGTEPVRGTFKNFYHSRMRVLFSDLCWSTLSQQTRSEISVTVLRNVVRRAGDALEANTFDRKDDRHLSLQTVAVDLEGWDELRELMATTMTEVDAIASRTSERVGAIDEGADRAVEQGTDFDPERAAEAETFPATVTLLNFESPRLYETA
jgi:DNA-binding transcriptional ArsR family regulator